MTVARPLEAGRRVLAGRLGVGCGGPYVLGVKWLLFQQEDESARDTT